jgi:lambda repressor-like predicted transcriptional regulator
MQNFPTTIPQDTDKVVMVVAGEARTGLAGNLKDKDLRTEVENARNGQLTLSNRLSNMEQATTNEMTRAQNAETGLTADIASESNRAKLKENSLQNEIDNEISRAQNAENTINNIITTNKPIWDDKYTQAETDNKIAAVVSGLDWKEGVHAYSDLSTTYPTPQKGWTVAVEVGLNNAPTYYRWNGTEWEDVGLEAIPKATSTIDGLMTKEYASKLDGIVNVKPTNYIYVGKNGDNNNDGSANKPYLTVQKAIDTATSGTAIFIFPGNYTENLTFKANVYLTCATKFTTTITGNHIIDFNGTVICENILFNSNSGNTLSFQGTNLQNFQLIGSSVYSSGGDAINWSNTNASSKILFEDGTVNVASSGTSARAFYSNSTAKGSFILNRVSCKVDALNNVCLAIGGFLNVSYTADQIIGQVTVSDTATTTFGNLSMTTTSVPVLNTNSSGMSTLASVIVNTTSSPIVSGAGAFSFVAILYANVGVGGASTLNGGYGPLALQMASIKLRDASLLPSGAISAGLVNGEFEFDGTDLYFTKSNVRYKVDMGKKDYYQVDTLPTTNISINEMYLLSTDRSINVYDGTAWHKYGGTGGGHTIKDSITTFIQRSNLQFIGGVSLSDDSINDTTIVNVAGGSSSDASSINNHIVDNSSYATGRPIVASGSGYTHADFNIAGIVATDGNILKASGAPATIAPGTETIFEYPPCTADKFLMGIQEVIAGTTVTDTHLDFSDVSKYSLQDSAKILIGNNKAQLDIYTKALLHMDEGTFKDELGHTITNSGVTLDTTNKVFGNGSAYFNGSSYLTIPASSDFNFGINDFTIDFRFRVNSLPSTNQYGILDVYSTNNDHYLLIYLSSTGGLIVQRVLSSTLQYKFVTSDGIVSANNWYNIRIVRKGSNMYIFKDGVLQSTTLTGTFTTSSLVSSDVYPCYIGVQKTGTAPYYMTGNVDELKIMNGIALTTSNYSIPTSAFGISYNTINVPLYTQTTGNSNYSLTTIDTISSLTMPFTTPTNTSIKTLTTFDNGTNWLYHNGTGWHKFTGDITQSWTGSNSNTDLQTYFTNLSMTQLKTDLSALNIIPVALDFIWQLNTSTLSVTPSIGQVTMVYTTLSHLEAASFGSYDEQYVKFGVKKILDPTDTTKTNQMSIKNLTAQSRTIIPNVLITTT